MLTYKAETGYMVIYETEVSYKARAASLTSGGRTFTMFCRLSAPGMVCIRIVA